MKRLIFFLLFAFIHFTAQPQNSYWQQQVATQINVTLDDEHHFLRGDETIVYTNNSPDTLTYLYLHLWANAYKHDHTQFAEQQYVQGKTDFYYAKPNQRGFIDSLSFEVDGNELNYYSTENTPDIARLNLIKPLAPGAQITIFTPFRVKIPKVFSRMGHTKQAYFISQWFPKPAVYDRKGWHPIPYLDQGEFYSEYGSYDVNITLPKNYVVMATGNLLNEEENKWLDSLAAINWYDTSYAKTKFTDSIPPSSYQYKTLHFHENNVHDFAWFADKRFIVRKDTFNDVSIYTAFLPAYKNSWRKGTQALKDALITYGKYVGPYPYKTIKAVQGDMKAGGGMEYPTVTIIDKTEGGDKDVIVHEAGHNWFYGILGSNERDHAWMDEGINTFYEMRTMMETADSNAQHAVTKKKKGIRFEVDLNKGVIAQLAASGKDQAIDQTSKNFREINYGMDVYYKTAWFLGWLEAYMGKEAFENGMHEYYQTWKFRHPYPEDFRAVMEKNSPKNLDWFFNDLMNSEERIDFVIKNVKRKKQKTQFIIDNKTQFALPVGIITTKNDTFFREINAGFTQGASYVNGDTVLWIEPFKGKKEVTIMTPVKWDKIAISPTIADMKSQNNEYRRYGLFHKSGVQLKPFTGFNTGNKQKIFWLPAIGYNIYDGFGAGLVFHNITMPENKFRFILAPMYGFRSKTFNGLGSVAYVMHPEKTFQEISLQLDAKSFNYNESGLNIPKLLFARYTKIAPSLSFIFKEPEATSSVKRSLLIKGYGINEEDFIYNQSPADSLYRPALTNQTSYYGLLRYTHENSRTFNPFSYQAEIQGGKDFAKLMAEATIRIDYNLPKKSLYVRAFAGKFLTLNNASSLNTSRYFLNSTFSGVNDYLYDDTYIGRSEQSGFSAHQISFREGGLKIPTPFLASPLGRSDNWLAALNLKTDLPVKLPVRLFLDVATFADAHKLNPSGNKILFDAGVEVHVKDIIHIYIPLLMSSDYSDYFKSVIVKDKLLKSITFSMDLGKIEWLKASSEAFKLVGY